MLTVNQLVFLGANEYLHIFVEAISLSVLPGCDIGFEGPPACSTCDTNPTVWNVSMITNPPYRMQFHFTFTAANCDTITGFVRDYERENEPGHPDYPYSKGACTLCSMFGGY